MDIRYISPFIEATRNAFKELFGVDAAEKIPYLMKKEDHHDWEISGVIGIAGEARGVVVLSFPEHLAQDLTAAVTGQPTLVIDDDVTDAVGELVNIIAGNAKKGLEDHKLMISLPSIIQGLGHKIAWPSVNIPIVGIPFSTTHGDFNLAVGLENIITT